MGQQKKRLNSVGYLVVHQVGLVVGLVVSHRLQLLRYKYHLLPLQLQYHLLLHLQQSYL